MKINSPFCVGILISISVLTTLAGCASGSKKNADGSVPALPVLWTLKESIQNPESAYFDASTKTIYVSNVAGGATDKDGQGWISKVDPAGQLIAGKWVTGLHAPKGLRASGGTLWVSDIDEVVSIDLASGKIKNRIAIKGAKFLNDVAVGPRGEVYVSDTVGNAIYVVRGKKASVFVQGPEFEAPNGLAIQGDSLIVAGWGMGISPDFSSKTPGHLYRLDLKSKKKTLITREPLGNLDGLEIRADGTMLVSDWVSGKIYSVSPQGEAQLILENGQGTADIGWIESSKTLLIPQMKESSLKVVSIFLSSTASFSR